MILRINSDGGIMKPTLHSVSLKRYRKLSMYYAYNNPYNNINIKDEASSSCKSLGKFISFINSIRYLRNNNPNHRHRLSNFRFTRVHLNLSNFR